jgi:hypothetical protein
MKSESRRPLADTIPLWPPDLTGIERTWPCAITEDRTRLLTVADGSSFRVQNLRVHNVELVATMATGHCLVCRAACREGEGI